ncbi:MAG: hypothetical protein K6E43_09005 [Lachnospiraceae bacterium]|nr:hypothetical protein [Lachnospiraceae bacterium]
MKKIIIIIMSIINFIDLALLTNGFKRVLWTSIPITGMLVSVLVGYAILFHIFRLTYFYNISDNKNLMKALQTIVLSAVIILFFAIQSVDEFNMFYSTSMFGLFIISVGIDGSVLRKYFNMNQEVSLDSKH